MERYPCSLQGPKRGSQHTQDIRQQGSYSLQAAGVSIPSSPDSTQGQKSPMQAGKVRHACAERWRANMGEVGGPLFHRSTKNKKEEFLCG